MNTLDLVIIASAVMGALGGYRLGFITRAISWVGMAAGLIISAFLVPPIVRALENPTDGQVLLVYAGVLLAGAFVGQIAGMIIGARLHLALPVGVGRQVDRVAGGGLGVLGVVIGLWLLLPTLVEVDGGVARQARSSSVAGFVQDVFPEVPGPLQDLRDFVGDEFPRVFADARPAPRLGPPPPESGLSDELADQIETLVAKVEGLGGQRIQQGSAFSIGDGLWVTNAHVVACVEQPELLTTDGAVADSDIVGFDPDRDLALLRAPALVRPALAIRSGQVGDRGAVFGFPGGGGLELSPYEIGRQVVAEGRDLYDSHDTERDVFFLASEMRSGDSGAALVSPAGELAGVAFAIAPDRRNVGYALTGDELNEFLAETDAGTVVDSGPCVR